MEFSNVSPFHSDSPTSLNDEIKKLDTKFKHLVAINKWDDNLKKASQAFLQSYHLLSMIKAKIGTKEEGTAATELTFGYADSDYINSYQTNWIRDEHIERFHGMKFGPKSLLEKKEYSKSEIEEALKHHLSVILPNQPEAQLKYLNYFKSNYVVDPPFSPSELTDLQLLWNIIHDSLALAFEGWISKFFNYLAEQIRKLKVEDANTWRYKLANGLDNPKYAPYLPADSVERFASGVLNGTSELLESIVAIIESVESFTEEHLFFIHSIVVTIRKMFEAINSFVEFLITLLNGFIEVLAHINAFVIGVYNGIIEFIASLFDLVAFFTGLQLKENRMTLIEGVEQFYEKYEKEGLWAIIKEILDTFIQKYKDAPDSYDIAKYLGEDIIQIVIEILITAATGGGAAVKRLSKILKDIRNGVFRSQLIGLAKVIDDVIKGRVKLNKYVDKFGNIKKRKKGDYTRYANFAEIVAHQAVLALRKYRGKPARFRLVNEVPTGLDDKIKKGIDAIYENELFDGNPPPPKYLINEVKANTKNSPIFNPINKLSKTKYGGKQMGRRWISQNIEQLNFEISRDIRKFGYDPIITGVNMNGDIHSMTLLDDHSKKIMIL